MIEHSIRIEFCLRAFAFPDQREPVVGAFLQMPVEHVGARIRDSARVILEMRQLSFSHALPRFDPIEFRSRGGPKPIRISAGALKDFFVCGNAANVCLRRPLLIQGEERTGFNHCEFIATLSHRIYPSLSGPGVLARISGAMWKRTHMGYMRITLNPSRLPKALKTPAT